MDKHIEGANKLIRLPRALHDHLKLVAQEQGVSTNLLIATLLAGSVGYKLDPSWKPPDPWAMR